MRSRTVTKLFIQKELFLTTIILWYGTCSGREIQGSKNGQSFFCAATGCVGRDVDFEVSKLLHLSSYHMENTPRGRFIALPTFTTFEAQ